MHVYLREEPVHLTVRETDSEGLAPDGAELLAIAFYVHGREQASFRSLLPAETISVLKAAMAEPVRLGLLAEEPEAADGEIQAMVGLALPVDGSIPGVGPLGGQQADEPWKASAGNPEAWRGDRAGDEEMPRTALLTFAPLIRIQRKFPQDFGEELADLLESALSGSTKSVLEARVDRMLGEL